MDSFLLKILCCPETRQSLRLANPIELEKLNASINSGTVFNQSGNPIHSPLSSALIREDSQIIYPICEDIPLLLPEEAILACPHIRSSEISSYAS